MIRTESEYICLQNRVAAEKRRMTEVRKNLVKEGILPAGIKAALDPMLSHVDSMNDELFEYENMKKGSFSTLTDITRLGRHLVGLRIFAGMTQKDLAVAMNVDQSQISRDERNEYRSATLERAGKVLGVLQARIEITVIPVEE